MHRGTFIAKPSEVQQTAQQLLADLQRSEHDKFAAHLYRSRREYRSACERSGKGGKQIERCLISTFQVAESMGFKGDFRQWEHLLRIADRKSRSGYHLSHKDSPSRKSRVNVLHAVSHSAVHPRDGLASFMKSCPRANEKQLT
jgi:hypothetical protein